MKKTLFAILTAMFLILPVSSLEWGGVSKSGATVKTKDLSNYDVSLNSDLFMWISSPIITPKIKLVAEGVVKGNGVISDGGLSGSLIVDMDLLKVSYANDFMDLSAGRFIFSDLTGEVLNQNVDGARFVFSVPVCDFTVYAGYTGFLNELTVPMLNADAKPFTPLNNVYSLAYPFLIGGVSVEFPVTLRNQSVGLEALAVMDLTDVKENRFYGNVKISGPVGRALHYTIASSFGSVNFKNITNFTKITMGLYPSDSFGLNFGAEYASGNLFFLSKFSSVSSNPIVNNVMGVESSGRIGANLGMSIYTNVFAFEANAAAIFAMPEQNIAFNGVQGTVNMMVNIFYDLQLSAGAYAYIDFVDYSFKKTYGANINLALAF